MKTNIKNYLILIITLILCVMVGVIYFAKKVNRLTPSRNGFSGGVENVFPIEMSRIAAQTAKLRNKVPIEQPEFSIEFNYRINRFVVILHPDTAENREKFNSWLNDAGYSLIPEEKFIIK